MNFKTVSANEVISNITILECIDVIRNVHLKLFNNKALQPLRSVMIPEVNKILGTMPAYIGGDKPILGLKIVSVFHENHTKGLETHQASIILLDTETGIIKAIIEGAEITKMRTAAASAVATAILSRKNSMKLALIGTGEQAHSHLNAITKIRDIEEIYIWNRTSSKAKKFLKFYSNDYDISLKNSIKQVTKGADIICTLTASKTPILDYVDPGTHINAVGSSTPNARELSTNLIINQAKLYTDVLESAWKEAGDYIIAMKDVGVTKKIIDLGSLISDPKLGRTNEDDITIYKSLGVGIQDIAVADFIYQKIYR